MADKEATIYIIDVGKSMSKKQNGRNVTNLDWSLRWLEDKLTNVVYMARKTLVVGVLGLGTNETNNAMPGDAGYMHISQLQEIQAMTPPDLRKLSFQSTQNEGDALSAIILATDMISKYCKKLKWKKQIVLITNAAGAMDPDDVASTAQQIKNEDINLLILGVDFDDSEYGVKEENKSLTKAANEESLRELANQCNGKVATMAEAIEGLAIPYIRPVRPTPTYKGQLCLGDPATYETAVTIDIERYFKVAVKKPPTASSYVIRGDAGEKGNIQTIDTARTYQVPQPDQPGGMLTVERDELAKGYEYGRTAVHISESDENITKLETDSSYDILGFCPRGNVERYMILENTNMLVAQKGNAKAALALSSFIHALYELDSVAIARFVKKDMAEPQLTLLSPLVEEEIECLIENNLPFAEDLRQYRFPPVDRIVTISGKKLDSHRNLPNNALMSAMSDFVDSMNLKDKLTIDETYSPANYSVESAIKHRAMHDDTTLPTIPEGFIAISKQPEDLQDQSRESLQRLIKAADVKKVPPKTKGRGKYRDFEKPLSGLNIDELFRKENRVRISPGNAIPEFKQLCDRSSSEGQLEDAYNQLASIVKTQIKTIYGDNYDQAIEIIGVMRQNAIDYEATNLYNDFISELKPQILAEELGGNRKILWYKIRVGRLGLIDQTEGDYSTVTKEQAENFWRIK